MTVGFEKVDVSTFLRDGFLVLDRLVGENDLEILRAAYDEVLNGDAPQVGDRMLGGLTRQVMMPSLGHAVFRSNGALDTARSIASAIFGETAGFVFDMLIYKPPGHRHATPWHQDMSYAVKPVAPAGTAIRLESIQFWVALDDVDVENGCMHFLPGYQTEPLLEHCVAAGDPADDGRLLALIDPPNQVDLGEVVPAPLRAGGATVHSYGTPHYTSPNRSKDRPRRAYIFSLATAGFLADLP